MMLSIPNGAENCQDSLSQPAPLEVAGITGTVMLDDGTVIQNTMEVLRSVGGDRSLAKPGDEAPVLLP